MARLRWGYGVATEGGRGRCSPHSTERRRTTDCVRTDSPVGLAGRSSCRVILLTRVRAPCAGCRRVSTIGTHSGPSCINQTDHLSPGDSCETRRTLAGDNFEPPGSAFSLRRASYYSPGLRQTGGTQLTRVLHFGEWVSDGGHSAAAELPALPVLQGSAFSISIPPGLASQYVPA